MAEFGVPSYKQYVDGESMMLVDGKIYRYGGTIPWSMRPWVSGNLATAFLELRRMCASIPVEAPWEAARARRWDATTLAQWLERHVPVRRARSLLEMALAGSYTSAATELSLLFVVYQLASAGGPDFVLGWRAQPRTRARSGVWARCTTRWPPAWPTDFACAPRPIDQSGSRGRHRAVRRPGGSGSRVIVSVPIAIAGQIIYEPALPADRSLLHQRMPSGAVLKCHALYDEPFWRADGLTGQSAAPETAAAVTIDAGMHQGGPGVLAIVNEGPTARRLTRMAPADREAAITEALAHRFDRMPLSPSVSRSRTGRWSGTPAEG